MIEIKMEFIGEGVDSVVFVQWLKADGDAVLKGEAICEVESYKALLQIESPASGILEGLKYKHGDIIQIPAVIGYMKS